MKIALVQTKPLDTLEKSLEKALTLIKKARANNADLVLFPEMFSIGYNFYTDPFSKAITLDSSYLNEFRKIAKLSSLAIAITFLEQKDNNLYNSALLINNRGEDILHYSKVHTCDFSQEALLTAGNDFFVADLVLEKEIVKVGFMICFDREFPESARILMLKGAEIILVPNACEMEDNRLGQLKARAFENSVGIALSNYTGEGYKGRSLGISPITFDEQEKALDTILLEADETESLFFVDFDLEKIRNYRKREVWGNAYRKEKTYKILIENIILEDFHRKDKRKLFVKLQILFKYQARSTLFSTKIIL